MGDNLACEVAFFLFFCFFFNDTATTEIYTLSLHDALPISVCPRLQIPSRTPPTLRFCCAAEGKAKLRAKAVSWRSYTTKCARWHANTCAPKALAARCKPRLWSVRPTCGSSNGPSNWQDRSHFFAVASHTMRRVLVDYARARQATKRSGGTAGEAVKGGVGGGPVFRQHQVLRHAAGDSFSTPGPAGNTRSGADRGRAPAACGCRHRWN